MQVHDDIQPSIASPANKTIEILQPAPGVPLVVIHEILLDPEADGYADGVEPVAGDLGDVALGDPRLPVRVPGGIRSFLAEVFHAGPLAVEALAAHARPFVFGEPLLDDE